MISHPAKWLIFPLTFLGLLGMAHAADVTLSAGFRSGSGAPLEVSWTLIQKPSAKSKTPRLTTSKALEPFTNAVTAAFPNDAEPGEYIFRATASDGIASSHTETSVIVHRPNSAPSFSDRGAIRLRRIAGEESIPWATRIQAGRGGESSQSLKFNIVLKSGHELFEVPPAVARDGTLTFKALPGLRGIASGFVTLTDNGWGLGDALSSRPHPLEIHFEAPDQRQGSYSGLIQPADKQAAAPENLGSLTLRLTSGSSFSARLQTGSLSFPLTGTIGNDGIARTTPSLGSTDVFLFPRKNQAPLSVRLRMVEVSGDYRLRGSITIGTEPLATIEAACVIPSATSDPNQKDWIERLQKNGKYATSLSVQNADAANGISKSNASISVLRSALVSIAGKLPDGSSWSGAWPICENLQAPVFGRINRNGEALSTWLVLPENPDVPAFSATLNWLRKSTTPLAPSSPPGTHAPNGSQSAPAAGGSTQGAPLSLMPLQLQATRQSR